MIRYKIKDIAFECNEQTGAARIITNGEDITFVNPIEAWNSFTMVALKPLENELRDKLEANGFNRWTGVRV